MQMPWLANLKSIMVNQHIPSLVSYVPVPRQNKLIGDRLSKGIRATNRLGKTQRIPEERPSKETEHEFGSQAVCLVLRLYSLLVAASCTWRGNSVA